MTEELKDGEQKKIVVEEAPPVAKKKPLANPLEPRFKLNMYNSRGLVRPDIPKSILYDVATKWGDIIKNLSSSHAINMNDLVEKIWTYEKKHPMRKNPDRTRRQIEDGITELVEKRLVIEI